MADDIDLRDLCQAGDERIVAVSLRRHVAAELHLRTLRQQLRAAVDGEARAVRQDGKIVDGADQIIELLLRQRRAAVPLQPAVEGKAAAKVRLQAARLAQIICQTALVDRPIVCERKRAVPAEAQGVQARGFGVLRHARERVLSVVVEAVGVKTLQKHRRPPVVFSLSIAYLSPHANSRPPEKIRRAVFLRVKVSKRMHDMHAVMYN